MTSQVLKNASPGATTATASYAWDGAGNRTGMIAWTGTPASHTTTNTTTATYDHRDELTSMADKWGTTTDLWNANGTPEISSWHASSGYYPPGGNTTAVTRFTWNAFGDPETFAGAGLYTSGSYSYDALGRMTTASGSTSDADGNVIASGSAAFTYGGLSAEPSSDGTTRVTRDPGGTTTSATSSGSAAASLLQDAHGNILASYNPSTAAVTGASTYDPFGRATATTGQTLPLGYQRSWTDPVSGFVTAEARLYNPSTGTFLTPDPSSPPITSATGTNPYLYAGANPTTYNDPTGLFSIGGFFDDILSTGRAALGLSTETLQALSGVAADYGLPAAEVIGGSLAATAAGVALVVVAGVLTYEAITAPTPAASPGSAPSLVVTNQGIQPPRTPVQVKPYVVSTNTWTVQGKAWTQARGESWDSSNYYYTDHYRYDTTYQQTLYSDGSLSPVRVPGSKLVHWRATQAQPIINWANVIHTPQMSATDQQRFDSQVPTARSPPSPGQAAEAAAPQSTAPSPTQESSLQAPSPKGTPPNRRLPEEAARRVVGSHPPSTAPVGQTAANQPQKQPLALRPAEGRSSRTSPPARE